MGQYSFLTAKLAFEVDEPKRDFVKKKENVLTVFDWDDTLMCTTIFRNYNRKLEGEDLENVKKFGKKVKQILLRSKQIGEVYIISNSSYSWIGYTAQQILGLNKNDFMNVSILSCRDNPKINIYDKEEWKQKAFELLINDFSQFQSIIFIGDNNVDIDYSHVLKDKFPDKNISTIKFIVCPSNIDTLNQEIIFLLIHLKEYIHNSSNVDLSSFLNKKEMDDSVISMSPSVIESN